MNRLIAIFFLLPFVMEAAYVNIDTNGNVKSPTNFPKLLVLSGDNTTAQPTNTPDGWAIRIHSTGGGGGDAGGTNSRQWGVIQLSNLVTMASFYWTNAQASAMLLSNLVNNPYAGYTNKAMQVAANNALSNLQSMASFYWTNSQASAMSLSNLATMASFYWTNAQASAMVLSNIVGMANFYWTNAQNSSMVLSNLAGMVSFYWTNAQASAMLLSNLVSNPNTTWTNTLIMGANITLTTNADGTVSIAASLPGGGGDQYSLGTMVLSNLATMASFYWTNGQASSMVLSNLVNNPYTGYTNKAFQVAANNVLSNIQTMASFYWTNAQASSMVLSNIASMASLYWTNAQASAMLLSNLVNNPYTGYTNKAMQVAANNVLSNLQTMATFYWTNAQASSMVLSNLAANPFVAYTNILAATNLATGANQIIDLGQDSTVSITNDVAGNVNVLLTNCVDRKWFVMRAHSDGSARTIAFFTGGGTMTWTSTNGTSSATNAYMPASKVCTVVGRVWLCGAVTNIDLFCNVQP